MDKISVTCNCDGCRISGLADEAILNIMELVRIEEDLFDHEANGELILAAKTVVDMRHHLITRFVESLAGKRTPCGQSV